MRALSPQELLHVQQACCRAERRIADCRFAECCTECHPLSSKEVVDLRQQDVEMSQRVQRLEAPLPSTCVWGETAG